MHVIQTEVAIDILANRSRPLLTVEHFVLVIVLNPINRVERKAVAHRFDNGITLFRLNRRTPADTADGYWVVLYIY